MAYQGSPQIDQQALKRMLLALYLRQMMNQQGRGPQQQQQGNSVDKIVDTIKKGKDTYDQGKSIYNLFAGNSAANSAGAGATQASQAAWNAGADKAAAAANDAWNAGANAASGSGSAGSTGTNAANTGGTNYAGWAAAALSAYMDAKKLMGDNLTDEQKALEGSRAIPRAVAAYYTGGASLAAENFARKQWGGTMAKLDKLAMKTDPFMLASRLWTSDKWKKEGNRLKALQNSGVDIPEWAQARMFQKRGAKKSELINPNYDVNFQGNTAQGYVDNLFENTRDESKMAPQTMEKYAVWAEKRPDWFKLSEAQRQAATLAARDAGALREHHGTLDINDQLFNQDAFNKAISSAPGVQAQAPRPQQPSRYMLKNGELFLRKGMK